MSRIYQNADKYAVTDFQQEIRQQQGRYNLMSVRSLATAVGIPHTTLAPKLCNPKKLSVADLQKLVNVIHPDPIVLLGLLGYSKQEIRKIKEWDHR